MSYIFLGGMGMLMTTGQMSQSTDSWFSDIISFNCLENDLNKTLNTTIVEYLKVDYKLKFKHATEMADSSKRSIHRK